MRSKAAKSAPAPIRGQAPRRWRTGAVALCAAAAGVAAYGALLYFESFAGPAGCCGATAPQPNPVQTERLLLRADPRGVDAGLQELAARAALAARPVDSSAWLRLAYADALRNGRLTPQGRYAFRTSYTMAAYAGRNAGWRTAFGLDHWYDLDADTRSQLLRELDALNRDVPRREAALTRIGRVTNPLGRYEAYRRGMLPPPAPAKSTP